MPSKFPDVAFSPARKAASERASLADELESALEIAIDILGNYASSPLASEAGAMIERCERAGIALCEIYTTFDEKSASKHAEMLEYRTADRDEKIFEVARTTRDEASALIKKLQATANGA